MDGSEIDGSEDDNNYQTALTKKAHRSEPLKHIYKLGVLDTAATCTASSCTASTTCTTSTSSRATVIADRS